MLPRLDLGALATAPAALVVAVALAAALTGCHGAPTGDVGPSLPRAVAAAPPEATSTGPATAAVATGCPPLPSDCAAPIRPDFPGPRNSDGTSKRLPPAPPGEPGHSVVLCYDDFGTQAQAFRLLGMGWWSWEGGGSFEPGDRFDVRVVVFQGQARKEVESRYPTLKGQSDYRIVARDEALLYLDQAIAELTEMAAEAGPGEYDFGPSRQQLEQTRSTIIGCLPP